MRNDEKMAIHPVPGFGSGDLAARPHWTGLQIASHRPRTDEICQILGLGSGLRGLHLGLRAFNSRTRQYGKQKQTEHRFVKQDVLPENSRHKPFSSLSVDLLISK